MTTITCPACGRCFVLKHKPPRIFSCPKCSFTTSFTSVLSNSQTSAQMVSTESDGINSYSQSMRTLPDHGDSNRVDTRIERTCTKVIPELGGGRTEIIPGLGGGGKTEIIESLQQKKYGFRISFQGTRPSTIILPNQGQFTLGRKSSDSTANIKLSPDMAMSRVHAGMRIILLPEGGKKFQITSVKDSNPIYVNGMAILRGKAINLKTGDRIQMGETELIFGKY